MKGEGRLQAEARASAVHITISLTAEEYEKSLTLALVLSPGTFAPGE